MSTVVADSLVVRDGDSALHKATLRLLPLLALGYGIAYMDRANIGFASLQMNEDLHFSATVYGLGGGLFFLSYAVLEVPSNLMLVRFGARRWLARIMLTWGVLATGMMFVKTPTQFYAMRFLLGAAEAGFFPGVVLYLTYWFPATHRGRAINRFYFAFPVSSVVMGALAGALLGLEGRGGLAGWQWLFLLEGLPAVLLSVVIFMVLPDSPADAPWLTDGERQSITRHLATESQQQRSHGISTAVAALNDRRIVILGVANMAIMAATYASILSAPLVIRDVTGWSNAAIGATVSLSNVGAALAMLVNGTHSDLRSERHLHTIVPILIVTLGCVMMTVRQSVSMVIGGYVMTVIGGAAAQAGFWLIPSDEFKGRLAEVGVAAIGSIGMIGAFVGPYAFGVARDYTGSYQAGLLLVAALYAVAATILLGARRIRGPIE